MTAATPAMIGASYAITMAAYNSEMNRRLYAAAAKLTDGARRVERGAFWGSIHGTLCHLLWGDSMWMSRFDGWAKPNGTIKESAHMIEAFDALMIARTEADAKIAAWAERLTDDWLRQDLVWFSGTTGRELKMPRDLLVTHFFNHQTHHRGQAHALITAAGEQTGDTDLFIVARP